MAKQKRDKLFAEWFWTDRWTGSRGFCLPMEPRGLYREMLTQAWRRGGQLPNDHEAIRRITGCTEKEWKRCWPLVQPFWTVEGEYLVNVVQVVFYSEAKAASDAAQAKAKLGASTRWAEPKEYPSNAQASTEQRSGSPQAVPKESPLITDSDLLKNSKKKNSSVGEPAPNARSARPIFKGQRLTVFEWMLDDCASVLGEHADAFRLDEWFFTLDANAVSKGLVIPKRDGGAWLQGELVHEAQRRGIPLRMAAPGSQMGKQTSRLMSAMANIMAEGKS